MEDNLVDSWILRGGRDRPELGVVIKGKKGDLYNDGSILVSMLIS